MVAVLYIKQGALLLIKQCDGFTCNAEWQIYL